MEITKETRIEWLVKKNPKREGSKARARFAKYMNAATVGEYLERGGLRADLKYDAEHGFLSIVTDE